MSTPSDTTRWPELPYAAWKDTCADAATVDADRRQDPAGAHAVAQSFLARDALCDGARPDHIADPDGARSFQIDFDFVDHVLWVRTSDGHVPAGGPQTDHGGGILCRGAARRCPNSASRAHQRHAERDRRRHPVSPRIASTPPTIATTPTASGASCSASNDVFTHFRTGFLGKASPVHFFWGSFDLAVTRFSGRRAPLHPGGVPNLPDDVAQEAYSHEVSSAGFWPGGGAIDYPAYYSYAYPAPDGFAAAPVRPAQAFFSKELGEFILPYDAVRIGIRSARGLDGISPEHLRCGGGPRANGIARRSNAQSARRGGAARLENVARMERSEIRGRLN